MIVGPNVCSIYFWDVIINAFAIRFYKFFPLSLVINNALKVGVYIVWNYKAEILGSGECLSFFCSQSTSSMYISIIMTFNEWCTKRHNVSPPAMYDKIFQYREDQRYVHFSQLSWSYAHCGYTPTGSNVTTNLYMNNYWKDMVIICVELWCGFTDYRGSWPIVKDLSDVCAAIGMIDSYVA